MSKPPAKPARRKRRATTARAKASPAALRAVLLGRPLTLTYQHAGESGRIRRHRFARGARLTFTQDGRWLVIDGIQVRAFIDH